MPYKWLVVVLLQLQKSVENTEQHMMAVSDQRNTMLQAKMQQLSATLQRIAVIERELEQFKQALGMLYEDVQPPSGLGQV